MAGERLELSVAAARSVDIILTDRNDLDFYPAVERFIYAVCCFHPKRIIRLAKPPRFDPGAGQVGLAILLVATGIGVTLLVDRIGREREGSAA